MGNYSVKKVQVSRGKVCKVCVDELVVLQKILLRMKILSLPVTLFGGLLFERTNNFQNTYFQHHHHRQNLNKRNKKNETKIQLW